MKEFRYFRKDKQGRQGRAVTIYVNVQLECMELCLGLHEELAEGLWVRMKGGQDSNIIVLTRKNEWKRQPGLHVFFQPPQYLLEGHHSRA